MDRATAESVAPVIVRMSGGLGNQMFEYAIGKSIASKSGLELCLDLSSYANQKPTEAQRHYSLDCFNVNPRFATDADFKKLGIANPGSNDAVSKLRRKLRYVFEKMRPLSRRKVVIEPSFDFHPEMLAIDRACFIAGVWQSEKYFERIEAEIRADFTLKSALSSEAQKIKQSMATSDSVSVHIRRGDQVHDPRLADKQGLLSDDYYKSAVEYFRKKLASPHFFVFSDEIDWVKQNLDFGESVTFVSQHGLPDYEELMLMSSCKHNVVAKSSYSWWGAWLNPNKGKTVITPMKRFGSISASDKDLIPETWIRM